QSDVMLVYRDWFGLINHGLRLTPVGASDSHDVSRYILGQGRTYIRANDLDPSAIDVSEACRNLLAGRALVSMGLLCEITVDGQHGPGDVVAAPGDIEVTARVLGPRWTQLAQVTLFANGIKIREAEIREPTRGAIEKWKGTWRLPKFKHDVFLAAV